MLFGIILNKTVLGKIFGNYIYIVLHLSKQKQYNMKTKLLHLRIEEDLLKELEKLAESNSLSVSAQVRMLIKHGLLK